MNYIKKIEKIIFMIIYIIAITCIISIYFIKGQTAVYAWNLLVFIIAPFAIFLTLIEFVGLIICFIRKKRIIHNLIFFIASLILSLPITVLFGISPVVYPDNANYSDTIILKVPVEEAVILGGKDYKTHAMWPSERYAYDISKKPYNINSNNLNDYGIFDSDVIAPVSGTIIGIENNEPDIIPNTEEFSSSYGNYIFIKIDKTNTYLILAHLKKDSILVKTGDHIITGQIIGKVGNSGTTSEPHLHIQHQRNNPLKNKISICAEGLPIVFVK